jgi:hypothetical protein
MSEHNFPLLIFRRLDENDISEKHAKDVRNVIPEDIDYQEKSGCGQQQGTISNARHMAGG